MRRSRLRPWIAPVALVAVLLGTAAVLAPGNGSSRRLKAHETLVAQTATEMQQRGDYLVPYYNDTIRLEKPPLPYWLALLAHHVAGDPHATRVSEHEARFSSLAAGMLLLPVTFALGVVAFGDRRVGVAAAAMLATTWDFFKYSRSARPEMLYALFCALLMLGLLLAIRAARRREPTWPGALLAWTAAAAALYAKGPHHPLFFLTGTSLALLAQHPRLPVRRTLHVWMGLVLVAVLVLPYFAYLVSRTDGALGFWSAQMLQDKPIPLWLRPLRFYFPAAVVAGFAPWLVALGLVARDLWRRRHPNGLVLGACVGVTIVALSFGGKLRHHYVLPVIPLLAVLGGAALVRWIDDWRLGAVTNGWLRGLTGIQVALAGVALVGVGVASLHPHPVSGHSMWIWSLPLVGLGLVALVVAIRILPREPLTAYAAVAAALIAGFAAISAGGVDSDRHWASAARFARTVAERVPPDQPVYLEEKMEEAAFVYYGDRRVVWSSARDWLEADRVGTASYFVCEMHCESVDARVVAVEKDAPPGEAMMLFEAPRRDLARADGGSDSALEAASPRGLE
jgi:4-amino-4-deoxy-L-arabinose transferase-like glycosyltransferase